MGNQDYGQGDPRIAFLVDKPLPKDTNSIKCTEAYT